MRRASSSLCNTKGPDESRCLHNHCLPDEGLGRNEDLHFGYVGPLGVLVVTPGVWQCHATFGKDSCCEGSQSRFFSGCRQRPRLHRIWASVASFRGSGSLIRSSFGFQRLFEQVKSNGTEQAVHKLQSDPTVMAAGSKAFEHQILMMDRVVACI